MNRRKVDDVEPRAPNLRRGLIVDWLAASVSHVTSVRSIYVDVFRDASATLHNPHLGMGAWIPRRMAPRLFWGFIFWMALM